MRVIVAFLLISVVAFGQRGGGVRPGGGGGGVRPGPVGVRPGIAPIRTGNFGSNTGFGNVVYPGTGHAPGTYPITDTGFGTRLAATVSGYPPYTGSAVGGRGYRGARSVVYVGGYAYPGYYGYPGYMEPPAPQFVAYPQQPQQTAPQVVINQNFAPETARPIVQEYTTDAAGGIRVYRPPSSAAAPAPVEENPTYLIAFKDHTIYAALAYWVEGDTLHYVTNRNTHNQVSLDLIDREFSERLNRERTVDFRLPPAR